MAQRFFPKGNVHLKIPYELGLSHKDNDFVTVFRVDCGHQRRQELLTDRQPADTVRR
ncbi:MULTISPECIES: hypothetical protein [Nostoc]|uniref:Uncharacterized protein n=1 Tax=Nostoc paludosum FACHB-159 TaxID=2692908 RepID=A0ABR8KMD7_9NOSO|nr:MULTISPECIES: hypothetical protein [Nostoc]MBD2682743.1 hypothetical protein [Nostoc sp. FACHB-857]MBD2739077.1 hypothetical protein [Nostoc paludosum FACHB-159]